MYDVPTYCYFSLQIIRYLESTYTILSKSQIQIGHINSFDFFIKLAKSKRAARVLFCFWGYEFIICHYDFILIG